MSAKHNRAKNNDEAYIRFLRLAQNRGYNQVEADVMAKMAVLWNNNQAITGYSAAYQTQFAGFLRFI